MIEQVDQPDSLSETRPLRPMLGEVCAQSVRCGKPNCRCERGHLHGPYYYRVWRDGRGIHKDYIKRQDLPFVEACCAFNRALLDELSHARERRRRIIKNMKQVWRKSKLITARGRKAGSILPQSR